MEIAIYKLTAQEVKEQEAIIEKNNQRIQEELAFGDLMNPENVALYAQNIKTAYNNINKGIRFEAPGMVDAMRSNPNATIVNI